MVPVAQIPEPYNCLIIHLRTTAPTFEKRTVAYGQPKLTLVDGAYSSRGDVSFFYDWLRTNDETVVGVRILPSFVDAEYIFDVVKDLPYCVRVEVELEIFFGEVRAYDKELSGTQGFGECSAWMHADGVNWAIAIDEVWMEPGDLDHLSYEFAE